MSDSICSLSLHGFSFRIDQYSRMTINDSNRQISQRPQAQQNTISTIAPGNPLGQQSYRQSSSYESKYTSSTSNTSNYHREQSHSRESSPTAAVTNHRSPSPTNVQIPSANTYRPAVQSDPSSTSSRFAPPPRPEYYNVSDCVTILCQCLTLSFPPV